MFEVGFFVKCADVSTAATMRLDSAIIVTIATIFLQLFLKR
jgi:hypothetical protein